MHDVFPFDEDLCDPVSAAFGMDRYCRFLGCRTRGLQAASGFIVTRFCVSKSLFALRVLYLFQLSKPDKVAVAGDAVLNNIGTRLQNFVSSLGRSCECKLTFLAYPNRIVVFGSN